MSQSSDLLPRAATAGDPAADRCQGAVVTPAAQAAARQATRLQFAALGLMAGAWGAHVPSVKAHYGLSAGELSLALLSAAVGSVLCLSRAATMVQTLGAARVVMAGAVVGCAALGSALLPAGLVALMLLMVAMGGAMALVDVAINAEGSLLERIGGRKVMSGFHGMWSLGGMGGAALAGWMLRHAVAPATQLMLVAGLALVALVAGATRMLPMDAHGAADEAAADAHAAGGSGRGAEDGGAARTTAAPPRSTLLLLLGALGISGYLAEGAMYDWSVLWLHQDLGQPQAWSALGYSAFAAAMAAFRFAGDALRARIPAHRLLAVSALTGAAAMALALIVREPWIALACFVVAGAGLANMVPVIFMAASQVPGVPAARGIATVSALGYVGFVAGPPLVGFIAEGVSLTGALWVVVVAMAVLAFGARLVPR
ncbi:MAG: hypothetical protein RIQ53_2798 [Pseudomonadota bacterium]|jgi:fucose permease